MAKVPLLGFLLFYLDVNEVMAEHSELVIDDWMEEQEILRQNINESIFGNGGGGRNNDWLEDVIRRRGGFGGL